MELALRKKSAHLFENSHHTTKQIPKRNDTYEIKGKRKQ